ncbi:MAG: SDR family oxidoreductase [Chloroflexota bacterium]
MNFGIANKVAFVAGASSGIGKAIAWELASEGVKVTIGARTASKLETTATEIMDGTGGEVLPVMMDVTDRTQIEAAMRVTVEHFGRLDILVTNGGSAPKGDIDELDDATWERGWQLYFQMHVHLIRAALPHLRANEPSWGRIITVTSFSAKRAMEGLLLSSSLRPGVDGLVRSLASQLAPEGITVNNVAPGYTLTEQLDASIRERHTKRGISREELVAEMVRNIPIGRISQADEQAAAVAFLASTRAGSITGQTIVVDGGVSDQAVRIW